MSLCNSLSPTLVIRWCLLTFSVFFPCSLYFPLSLSHHPLIPLLNYLCSSTHPFILWSVSVVLDLCSFLHSSLHFFVHCVIVRESVGGIFIVGGTEVIYWKLLDCSLYLLNVAIFYLMNRNIEWFCIQSDVDVDESEKILTRGTFENPHILVSFSENCKILSSVLIMNCSRWSWCLNFKY